MDIVYWALVSVFSLLASVPLDRNLADEVRRREDVRRGTTWQ